MTKQQLLNRIDETYRHDVRDLTMLLNEETIKTLHTICSQTKDPSYAGRYRDIPAIPCGPGHNPPKPEDIDHFMKHFINQMTTSIPMFHPVEFAAIAYKRLLDIYPFSSFNEETALLYLNLLLSKSGYPILSIPDTRKEEYESAMVSARTMPFPDTDPLVLLIGKCIEATCRQ